MKRCVIVGGADINNYYRVAEFLDDDDYFVYCDSGLRHLESLGYEPDLIVGDWDSHEKPDIDAEIITLPHIKDDTDTFYAVKECVKRGFEEFILIGMIGGRFDHSLGNSSMLLYLDGLCKKAMIIDDWSVMTVVSRETAFVEDKYPYFSLLSVDGEASGISIRNALYELSYARIGADYQLGISNEVIPGKTAEISIASGRMLLIKIFTE
jgi:thiamine pyrophosphokinase